MIAAGIGCRAGASEQEIEAALALALRTYAVGLGRIGAVATAGFKCSEPGLIAFAQRHATKLVGYSPEQLLTVAGQLLTRSQQVERLTGVPSVAEAAALLAAGNRASLLGPRVVAGTVTCALAKGERP
jgi:cobalt-precorrin 5A hydrolase